MKSCRLTLPLLVGAVAIFEGCVQNDSIAQQHTGRELRALDSVSVTESDSDFVARPVQLLALRRGNIFVADVGRAQVLEIERNGHIVRAIGRRGGGPGEFLSPAHMDAEGDSLLFVRDPGKKSIERFRISTGEYLGSQKILPNFSSFHRVRGVTAVSAINYQLKAALMMIDSLNNEAWEGVVPAIVERTPNIVAAFPNSAFAVGDSTTYMVHELTPEIVKWKNGTQKAELIPFPRNGRRGTDVAEFEKIYSNPSKAADRIYMHSIPMNAKLVADTLLAIAMYDVDPVEGGFVGRFYVSYVNLRQQTGCLDIPIQSVENPPPRLDFDADTVILLQQDLNKDGKPAAAIRRFVFDGASCNWQTLKTKAK